MPIEFVYVKMVLIHNTLKTDVLIYLYAEIKQHQPRLVDKDKIDVKCPTGIRLNGLYSRISL